MIGGGVFVLQEHNTGEYPYFQLSLDYSDDQIKALKYNYIDIKLTVFE